MLFKPLLFIYFNGKEEKGWSERKLKYRGKDKTDDLVLVVKNFMNNYNTFINKNIQKKK